MVGPCDGHQRVGVARIEPSHARRAFVVLVSAQLGTGHYASQHVVGVQHRADHAERHNSLTGPGRC